MAIQDGLLSFAIKETIFLPAERAGIGELKELELVPDIEVLENQSFISITGCLQLYGTYEPARGASEPTEGGAETLVEAVTFAPFPQAGNNGGLFGFEEEVNHRIPVNITIPVSRVAEMGDIYAVVDGFDCQVETPHQLLIEAELKIAGIQLTEQGQQSALQPDSAASPADEAAHMAEPYWVSDQKAMQSEVETAEADMSVRADVQPQTDSDMHSDVDVESRAAEQWQAEAISPDQRDRVARPASLEELEQRLSELERMEREPHAEAEELAEYAAMFDRPASPLPSSQTDYGDVTASAEYGEVTGAWDQPALEADEYPEMSFHQAPPWEVNRASAREEQSRWESAPDATAPRFASSYEAELKNTRGVEAQAEGKETGSARPAAGESRIVEANKKAKEAGAVEARVKAEAAEAAEAEASVKAEASVEAEAAEAAEASVKAEETGVAEAKAEAKEADTVEAQEEPDVLEVQTAPKPEEEREVRVAISGKPTEGEGEKLNLTSIFSQASRIQQEAQAAESAESSSSSSRRADAYEPDSRTLEAMHNLTSFIRGKEERYSKLKLCIIQRNDTLESISQRYSLPISKILEVNKLSADQVVEGQILYIPE
ncbi:stage VI sporulation protein D [Brevibacillus aydinogluensis]|jgi:stage VI sporulation protein D|uniref:Peptidoglycan-binding protein LysM n=1 Tax=Brevibacillus aydinogluensis TaxID=927786 RepID=A0AA48M8W4_9BACL|nr:MULTISPECIES: LysM peptidoglycan-binding domain-containing protein [Brevibacillus]MBR8660567.1 LysM peptidoglycan-binding domain-containing protein [Brevibacillus sp. NL20B1]MDT3414346.1 stage VI sporulation protein D [Brevibacillus aydinogluensis]CAJ1003435.1 Peptidoglycan-binding protein LysM [Brevibacillus aydinogluensis]